MIVRRWTLAAAATVGLVSGCTHPVPGNPVAADATGTTTGTTTATGTTTRAAPVSLPDAATLLLPSGSNTPAGTATQTAVGVNYFTSATPESCSAAVLFKNSPLIPPESVQHAETAYTLPGTSLMAESADTYTTLDDADLVSNGFTAVSECNGDAVGHSPAGPSGTMRLRQFAMGDGTLTWSMLAPGWNCDYAMVVVPRAVMMLSTCSETTDFSMPDWADQRRAQLLAQLR